ncbi:hypothetical protein CDL15_Pgr027894 [Punica granatum]|uniref:Kinesin motor domain-containing protein n=1 Tax=Punica granatum TaxID=22663 RepID=A0A218XJH7_PUNGR|nr:hypothetical protein CDL15_Pgr027894 [Punica granatum]
MFGSSSRSQRSSASTISPFRSRKSPAPPPPASKRPVTPSSASSSQPSSRSSSSPATAPTSSGTPSSGPSRSPPPPPGLDRPESSKSKENENENVTVTVRFRPLKLVKLPSPIAIANFLADRVFGPATTTRHVYDVSAQHVVSGAMQGINGTVFAYGVTSSGKTHTMHGEQKSPGIIPLAVKDVFGIIQEVINDLLDPTGQNLRIREDAQGTYVEGIKEEVVLSPAHALSLIAAGEEHRHVGSNNFNLLSSRSHTIFTLTIESSPCVENQGEEDVTLSQLHLIDLAGSESSKTETTGLRRKEGSYINKSLLTLGTVISKLTDGKATHIPYRDSKLTRLLQSSLSGHGRISLICTVTPASGNSEEIHNTLKFAHRSKHMEVKASQNTIMDEKSLIKKYQKEISSLKEELQQLRHGMMENPYMNSSAQEDFINLKLQLEAGQVKLQSRLEEEEQDKAALMGRIQRLTKLILVSTKNAMSTNMPERTSHWRRHSFGEDELAYLPDKKRDYMADDDSGSYASELSVDGRDDGTNLDELVKDFRKNRRRGMLGWFKVKKPQNLPGGSTTGDGESSASASPASCSKSSQNRVTFSDIGDGRRKSVSRRGNDSSAANSYPERTQAGDLFSAAVKGRHLPPTGSTITDQMDLLREQVKMLAGEVALSTSSLKRLSEQAARSPDNLQLKVQMQKLKDEISKKKHQIGILEQRMIGSLETTPLASNMVEMDEALSKLTTQLNERTFELELKTADNRILQEQLQKKTSDNAEMQDTIRLLRQQLDMLSDERFVDQVCGAQSEASLPQSGSNQFEDNIESRNKIGSYEENNADENTPTSVMSLNRVFLQEDSTECNGDASLSSQVLMQAAEIESLKQDKVRLMEQKDGLEIQVQKLAEEASYAKELASAAAIELRNLAEEVTRLTYENAKLTGNLAAAKGASRSCANDSKQYRGFRPENHSGRLIDENLVEDLQRELDVRRQKEAVFETIISRKEELEVEFRGKLDEAKQREENLESELANLWAMVAKMRKSGPTVEKGLSDADCGPDIVLKCKMLQEDAYCNSLDGSNALEELKASYQRERERCRELESLISRLKGEGISGLDVVALEELQNLHVEAITKICHAKVPRREHLNLILSCTA